MLTPSKDWERFNYFLNHPDIYPDLYYDGYASKLDSREAVNVGELFTFDNGAVFYYPIKEYKGTYLGECMFLPLSRGAEAKKAVKQTLDYMFSNGAELIVAEVLSSNKKSQYLVGELGFKRSLVTPNAQTKHGTREDLITYTMRKEWIR